MKKLLNSKGYTLAELLIVLLMITIIVTISAAFLYRNLQVDEETAFKEQLVSDLHQAHLTAITNRDHVTVNFYQNPPSYILRSASADFLVKREFPPTVKLLPTSTLTYFRFLPTGNTSSFGVIRFSIDNEFYAIHYYLGKGRFYAEG